MSIPHQHDAVVRWDQPTIVLPQAVARRAVGFVPRTEVDRWHEMALWGSQRRIPGLGIALWLVIAIPTAFLALVLGVGVAFIELGR